MYGKSLMKKSCYPGMVLKKFILVVAAVFLPRETPRGSLDLCIINVKLMRSVILRIIINLQSTASSGSFAKLNLVQLQIKDNF